MLKYLSPLQRNLPEFLLLGLLLVLAVFYGVFAVAAAHSARNGGADFYVTGADPWQSGTHSWQAVNQGQPVNDHRLAFRLAPSATP